MCRPPRSALTRDRVRHIGQSVAVVIAESVNQAKDAAEAIERGYAVLLARVSTAKANQPGMLLVWPECANNEASFLDYLVRARGNLEAIANPVNEE